MNKDHAENNGLMVIGPIDDADGKVAGVLQLQSVCRPLIVNDARLADGFKIAICMAPER